MATKKITEVDTASTIGNDAKIVITQTETIEGQSVEVLRRGTIEKVVKKVTTDSVTYGNTKPVSSDGVWASFRDGNHNALASVSSHGGHSGTLSAVDKEKLDGIEAEANKTVVGTVVKASENNPVSGAAVHAAIKSSNYLATGISNGTVSAAERQKLQNLTLYEKETHTIYPDSPLPFELEANTYNDLGKLVSDISLQLPSVKGDNNDPVEYGDIIQLDFITGSTAYSVGFYQTTAPHTILDYVAAANSIYSILFTWGAIGEEDSQTVYGWRIKTTTYYPSVQV